MITLRPMDIIVVNGQWFNPMHWAIQWRSIDSGVHCATVKDSSGAIYNPLFAGIKLDHIDKYNGRYISIYRYKGEADIEKLSNWCKDTYKKSKGYDFFRQWLLGYVLGIAVESIASDPNLWTCSEFPYWAFMENGYRLTSREEVLPLPRLFRYNTNFELIYEGIWRHEDIK